MSETDQLSPFSIKNVRLFVAFKVLFNSRFYYPVFTILFLDFGLTIAQFSILNAVWAATIVLAEVPSGAMADIIGRKKLMVFATVIMVVEVGIISFVPRINPTLIFVVFMINRILSGLAEAAASGADEAIAYDSLVEKGIPDQWGRVLEILMRYQSIGFIVAMSVGAAIYDPNLMTSLLNFIGIDLFLTQDITMRFPLYLTFILSLMALFTTLKLEDIQPGESGDQKRLPVKEAFALTIKAGGWILKTNFALTVILFGMMFDGITRVVITLSSQYYRMIELPESTFGIIGSLVAMFGLIIPKIAKRIAENRTPVFSTMVTAILSLSGLFLMSLFWKYTGLIPALITFSAMYFTGFFVSFYINQVTPSDKRATVLSFKGLAYNISYGVLGVLYAMLLKIQKSGTTAPDAENLVFTETFVWFPTTMVIWLGGLIVCYLFFLREKPKNS
jgi:MFS family permease